MQCGLWANGFPASYVLVESISSTSKCHLYHKFTFLIENFIEKSSWPLNKLNFASFSKIIDQPIFFVKQSLHRSNQRISARIRGCLGWGYLHGKWGGPTGIAHGSTNFNIGCLMLVNDLLGASYFEQVIICSFTHNILQNRRYQLHRLQFSMSLNLVIYSNIQYVYIYRICVSKCACIYIYSMSIYK